MSREQEIHIEWLVCVPPQALTEEEIKRVIEGVNEQVWLERQSELSHIELLFSRCWALWVFSVFIWFLTTDSFHYIVYIIQSVIDLHVDIAVFIISMYTLSIIPPLPPPPPPPPYPSLSQRLLG